MPITFAPVVAAFGAAPIKFPWMLAPVATVVKPPLPLCT